MAEPLGEWENLVLRLREKARSLGTNPGIMETSILMIEGHPHMWYAPVIRPLEPKRGDTDMLDAFVQTEG